ncbi:hypothetical protein [Pectobacterium sp. B1J-3]|uniref:hypothetical protein n=1 Tax=Pectobacterium sp. B1J-3 TaxID=3385371 RepID=UPI003906C223
MNINNAGKRICDHLLSASIDKEAMEIASLIKIIIDENNDIEERNEAIDNLLSRCHPKWLGDYYIKDVTYQEWFTLISKFNRALNKYKKRMLEVSKS